MTIDHRERATMVSAASSDIGQGSDPSLALSAVSERALRKNAWRLLPFLAFASFVHYMDRTNIAFAALSMNRDLGLTAAEFGPAASIFYFGYVLVSVPSSLAVYRYGARRWLACIMICWGLGAAAKALVTGPATLSTIRFIEGAAQAGFFPGVIYYLTLWFPPQYRARALAWFLVSIPVSAVIGGPVAVTLLQMDGVLGLSGWRWLFLIEGLPTVVFGLIALYVIVDGPKDAGWLTGEERRELLTVIADEPPVGRQSFLVALRDKRTSGLAAVFFLLILGVLGPAYWMPLILKSHGLSDAQVGWVSAAYHPSDFHVAQSGGGAMRRCRQKRRRRRPRVNREIRLRATFRRCVPAAFFQPGFGSRRHPTCRLTPPSRAPRTAPARAGPAGRCA